jgi:dTDP-4-amino-4,6-dideoxygalactose transaminase
MVSVTKTYLPPIKEYEAYLKRIWKKGWITNHGECVTGLEKKLKDYLKVEYLQCVSNGTLALQIAIKAFDLKGEIITTPFSYVATTDSILWENCTPVYADIEPDSLTIDPRKIEAAITPRTSAILATHVYGNPCDVEAISRIAKKHKLKVIYDAAHCFGVKYKGKSVLSYGDISVVSFHATKLYHTVEGGAIITNNKQTDKRNWYLRNFGHNGYEGFLGIGINAKLSELHAAMGLINLTKMPAILKSREQAFKWYFKELQGQKNISFQTLRKGTTYNFAYFPVVFKSEKVLLEVFDNLKKKNINPRRYFYPSLNTLPFTKPQHMPVSEDIASRVMCLPLYHQISLKEIKLITTVINSTLNKVKTNKKVA